MLLIRTRNTCGNTSSIALQRNHLLVGFVIAVFAIIPYVAVGKPARLWSFTDGEGRHGILLGLPIGLIVLASLKLALNSIGEWGSKRKLFAFVFSLSIVANILQSEKASIVKMYQYALNDSIIAELKGIGPPQPGTVHIQILNETMTSHSRFMGLIGCWSSFGAAKWFGLMDHFDQNQSGKEQAARYYKNYRVQGVMKDYEFVCHTELKLNLWSYDVLSALKYVGGFRPLPQPL